MIKKFKSFALNEKLIIIIISIPFIIITIKDLLNDETRFNTIEFFGSFMILFLWLFIYNNYKFAEKWFENNKLRILLTIVIAIITLYLNNEMIISYSCTKKIIHLFQSFLISSVMISISNKKLLDNNDVIICFITLSVVPTLIKVNMLLFIAFLLIIIFSYIVIGLIIKLIKQIRLKKEFIVDILGIMISIFAVIINFLQL